MLRSSNSSDSKMRMWDNALELHLSSTVFVQQDLNNDILILASTNNSRVSQPSLTAKAGNTNTTAAMVKEKMQHPDTLLARSQSLAPFHGQSSLDPKMVPGSPKTKPCLPVSCVPDAFYRRAIYYTETRCQRTI